MNPLTTVLGMLAATAASGSLLVAAFVLGHYDWRPVMLALLVGVFGAAALAGRLEDGIKRHDPAWDDRHGRPRPVGVQRLANPPPAERPGRHLQRR